MGLAWLTEVQFMNIIVRWSTGWINICLLTLTNKIWFFFLPSSEGAIWQTRGTQVGQHNLCCSIHCISSYTVQSSLMTCRGQHTSLWQWFFIISHVNYFSHHYFPSLPHLSKANSAWWYFTKWECKPYMGLWLINLLTGWDKPPSDYVIPNINNPHPDGFCLGKFSNIDLPEYLDGVSEFVQSHPWNTQVTAISWWSSHEAPWHHQFVTINVTHTTSNQTCSYTLLFECLGKLVRQEGIVKQPITINSWVHKTDFLKHSNLICVLVTTSVAIKSIYWGGCIGQTGEINHPSAPWEMWLCI